MLAVMPSPADSHSVLQKKGKQKFSGANVATVHEAERMSVKSVGVSQVITSSTFTLLFFFAVSAASPKSVDV